MKAAPFFKSLWYLIFLNVLVKPIWIFGVDRQVQNLVGHHVYGAYFALLNLSFVLSFLADAGLSNMLNRRLASGGTLHLRQLLRLKVALACLYVAIVLAIGWLTGIRHWQLLLLTMAIQVFTSFFTFFRSIITAHQQFTTDAWLSVTDKLLLLLFFLPLLYTPLFSWPVSIELFLYAQAFCLLTAVAAALLVILKNGWLTLHNAQQQAVDLFKASLPYALIILLMSAHNRLDGFLLERLHPNGTYEAGIYASAYRLLDAANVIGFLFASFLVPYISRHQYQLPLVSKTILASRHLLLLFGCLSASFIYVFSAEVQQLLYTAVSPYSASVLGWCIGALPAYLLLHLYGSLLTATAHLRPYLAILSGAIVLNILLNALLIPRYGAAGCTAAALVSQYACALVTYAIATRKLAIDAGLGSLAAFVLATGAATAFFYWGRQHALSPVAVLGCTALLLLLFIWTYMPTFKKYFVSLR